MEVWLPRELWDIIIAAIDVKGWSQTSQAPEIILSLPGNVQPKIEKTNEFIRKVMMQPIAPQLGYRSLGHGYGELITCMATQDTRVCMPWDEQLTNLSEGDIIAYNFDNECYNINASRWRTSKMTLCEPKMIPGHYRVHTIETTPGFV